MRAGLSLQARTIQASLALVPCWQARPRLRYAELLLVIGAVSLASHRDALAQRRGEARTPDVSAAAPATWGSGDVEPAQPPVAGTTPEEAPPPEPAVTGETSADGASERPSSVTPSYRHEAVDEADSAMRYTIERIAVRGNWRTQGRVVRRFVPFEAGDILDVDDAALELTRYRLLGTGFFRDVQLWLEKGSRHGSVVLVVEVVERNTIVINDMRMGLAADADARGQTRPLTAYAGLDAAETNLLGTGITLGGAVGLARDQLALRVRFLEPALGGSAWMARAGLLYSDGRDFFGNADVLWADPTQLTGERVQRYAVVQYKRFGGSLGLGRDLSITTQLWGHYRLETVQTALPRAASHVRGLRGELDREPLTFDIIAGRSVLSSAGATLLHNTRDNPFLPTRGWLVTSSAEVALPPLGSGYAFTRFDVHASHWSSLPWRHVIRWEAFAGAITGDAPFFEQYYVGDFSDFRSARLLGLNVERRPVPNFLDTSIAEIRYGHYAAKLAAEYRVPIYRGSRSVFGIDIFGSAGVFTVTSRQHLESPPGGYAGWQLAPVDLTANVGLRMDTSAGGFVFAVSNAIGFIPVLSQERR